MIRRPRQSTLRAIRSHVGLAALLCAGFSTTGEAAAVAQGPMIGAMSPTTVSVWVRLDAEAHVRLRYRPNENAAWEYVDGGDALASGDNALKIALSDLTASHVYAYEIGVTQTDGTEVWSGPSWFKTIKAGPSSVGFTVMADFLPRGKASAAFASAAATRPDFFTVIGDMDHSGPAIDQNKKYYPPEDWPIVLENMRSMHRMMRDPGFPIGAEFVTGLIDSSADRPQIPFYEVWDDHDYCANNSDYSCPFRDQAFQAWREYFAWPKSSGLGNAGCGGEGVYQRFSVGNIATVFMLDSRSNRAPSNDEHVATMLGECQRAWLIDGLLRARTVWKFILSPVTFNPGTKPWDAWAAYNKGASSERHQLLAAIRDNGVHNVVVISADIHSGGAVDDGTHSGLPEVSAPHGNMPPDWVNTYCRHDHANNILVSAPGTWTLGSLVDPNIGADPPVCLGNSYAGTQLGPPGTPPFPLDGARAPGFVRVDATASSASVRIFGENGEPRMGWRADGSTTEMRLDLQAE